MPRLAVALVAVLLPRLAMVLVVLPPLAGALLRGKERSQLGASRGNRPLSRGGRGGSDDPPGERPHGATSTPENYQIITFCPSHDNTFEHA